MDAIIIMTRVPIPNKTKTRLMDIYTGVECSKLHICFLKDIFKVCESFKNNLDIFISYTPENSYELLDKLLPDYMYSFPQQGKDLGERMYNSISHLFKLNYNKVILIGSDIPELKAEYIDKALDNLNSSDLCLGPTLDGGYYLVGLKKAYLELFTSKINWGKKNVFERTVEIAESNGLKVSFTNECRDIDTKEDIRDFLNSIKKYEIEEYPYDSYYYFKEHWRECFLGEL
ncbi:MAG: TIGR04282 family arsenosugar biosynthesis glycosyltransferase [Solirubrobacterales bacterium]